MKHQWKQRFSVVLSAAVMLSAGNVTTLYGAENDVVKKIAEFDELDEGIAVQILEIGADESDIRFPASLWVDWVLEEDETADENHEDTGEDRATKSSADKRVHQRKKFRGLNGFSAKMRAQSRSLTHIQKEPMCMNRCFRLAMWWMMKQPCRRLLSKWKQLRVAQV